MKKIMCFTAIGVALAMAGPASAKFKRITKEADFIRLVTDKNMVTETGHKTRVSSNGKFSGKLKDGRSFRGAWKWSGRFWCRAGTMDGNDMGQDCQVWEIDGNQVRNTRKKGKGDSLIWIIQ